MVEQRKEDKMKWVAQESTSFAEQLRANPVAFIASAALEPISEVWCGTFGLGIGNAKRRVYAVRLDVC